MFKYSDKSIHKVFLLLFTPSVFTGVPIGPSAIAARLESLLNKIIDQLEHAKENVADYGQIKPVNIIVLTNSSPLDNPAKVIRSAARKLIQALHHPNAVAIQFAHIGNDNRVEQALKKLSDDPSFVRTQNL